MMGKKLLYRVEEGGETFRYLLRTAGVGVGLHSETRCGRLPKWKIDKLTIIKAGVSYPCIDKSPASGGYIGAIRGVRHRGRSEGGCKHFGTFYKKRDVGIDSLEKQKKKIKNILKKLAKNS